MFCRIHIYISSSFTKNDKFCFEYICFNKQLIDDYEKVYKKNHLGDEYLWNGANERSRTAFSGGPTLINDQPWKEKALQPVKAVML